MPAMTVRAYAGGLEALLNKEWDANSDTIKATLHTATYVPNYDTDKYFTSATNELGTAGGYTAGGLTLSGLSISKTAANSWASVWTTGTAYTAGQLVRPSAGNGFIYVATNSGTSGGAWTPATTLYTTTSDGAVTWCAIGRGAAVFTFTNPSWATFTAGPFRQMVVSDTTPGSAATNPLILNATFASDQTGGGGTFTVTVDVSGALVMPY